jgi:uncharacterized Zn finger protein (UPF0148 family)
MAGFTVSLNVQLTTIDCGVCGGTYAINERYRQEQYEKGGSWYCPYCQTSWGYGEGENARLKKQLAKEKHKAEQADARAREEQARLLEEVYAQRAVTERTERRRAAMKGQVTRIKNRVGKGVCPCCNRTFMDLQRHMQGKHPDWTPEEEAEKAL